MMYITRPLFVCTCIFMACHPCLYEGSKDPFLSVPIDGPKVTAALWGPLDQYIITGHENGDLCQWDTKVRITYMYSVHVVILHLHICGKVLGVTKVQAWVVQKVDNAFCMINHSLVDSRVCFVHTYMYY